MLYCFSLRFPNLKKVFCELKKLSYINVLMYNLHGEKCLSKITNDTEKPKFTIFAKLRYNLKKNV